MVDEQNWLEPFKTMINTCSSAAYIVNFPEYRPDLFLFMARSLELIHFDFRTEVMSPYGWDAHQLSIQELDLRLLREADKGNLMICNVEALLATKEIDERKNWLQDYLSRQWPKTIVLPLCLYGHEAPESSPNVYSFENQDLPEQSFVNRLLM